MTRMLGAAGLAALVIVVHASPSRAQERSGPRDAPDAPDAPDALATGFRDPPPAARPHVWWPWMSGNVTAEGARLDLEWMKRIGIGGVHAFAWGALEQPMVPHPLPFMSEGWRTAFEVP